MVKRLPENNITLITSEIFTDDPTVQVENLKVCVIAGNIPTLDQHRDKKLSIASQNGVDITFSNRPTLKLVFMDRPSLYNSCHIYTHIITLKSALYI